MDLTPREREIAALLVDGMADAEIARTLFMSIETLAQHRKNVRAKLGRDPERGWIR